jgi:hypothetical protein
VLILFSLTSVVFADKGGIPHWATPEIDPGMVGSGLTLLGCCVALILEGYRRQR